MKALFAATALVLCTAIAVQADEAEDSLKSALTSYQAGKLKEAMDELAYAQQLIQTQRATALAAMLPAAPDGWTRTDNSDLNTGLNALGGGVGVEADYSGDGVEFKITVMANNAMVASMATMLGNTAMMAQMGKITKVGDRKFVNADGQLSGLVGTQVLVQAQGADVEKMIPILAKIDFAALEKFGS